MIWIINSWGINKQDIVPFMQRKGINNRTVYKNKHI